MADPGPGEIEPHGDPGPAGAARARTRQATRGVINDVGGASRFEHVEELPADDSIRRCHGVDAFQVPIHEVKSRRPRPLDLREAQVLPSGNRPGNLHDFARALVETPRQPSQPLGQRGVERSRLARGDVPRTRPPLLVCRRVVAEHVGERHHPPVAFGGEDGCESSIRSASPTRRRPSS